MSDTASGSGDSGASSGVDDVPTEAPVSSWAALRGVIRNRPLRKVQLAFAGSLLGDWAYATAIVVWAYQEGGAAAVGGYQAARFVVMAAGAPLGAAVADRMSRRTFMVVTDLVRAAFVAIAAVLVATDGPASAVFALAILVAAVGAPFRSAQAGLIPALVDRPSELTAANAVAGQLESAVIFAGPALGALLLGVTDVQTVFWFNVATYIWSMVLLGALGRVRRDEVTTDTDDSAPGFWGEITAGFALVARDPDLRAVGIMSGSAGFAWGAVTVFVVLLATEQLGTGAEGVGYLYALLGIATVVAGVVVLSRVGKGRLGQDLSLGCVGWGVPLLGLALFPSPVTVVIAFLMIGAADAFANIGFETIPQRLAPERYVSRVYAAMETALIAPMAVGAAAAPMLIELLGSRTAMALVGAVTVLVSLLYVRRMRELDRRLVEPEDLSLLRTVPIFAPLAPPTVEALAHRSNRRRVAGGTVVLAEGAASDEFFVIVSGVVEVTQEGRTLRTEGPGEFFGEIGLLRDVPRTATVTAVADSELLVLERADFLAAVSGVGASRAIAEETVTRRLAA